MGSTMRDGYLTCKTSKIRSSRKMDNQKEIETLYPRVKSQNKIVCVRSQKPSKHWVDGYITCGDGTRKK